MIEVVDVPNAGAIARGIARIDSACRSAFCLMKIDCSGFVKDVAHALNVPMSAGNADGIRDYVFANSDWKRVTSGAQAAAEAANGRFVLACLKARSHVPRRSNGHVVVVVPGSLYRGRYPKCYGGSLKTDASLQADGCYETPSYASSGDKTVGHVWNPANRDLVEYYAFQRDIV